MASKVSINIWISQSGLEYLASQKTKATMEQIDSTLERTKKRHFRGFVGHQVQDERPWVIPRAKV